MKVRVLQRNEQDFTRERNTDLQKVWRNYDPVVHPFERAREYQRALQATKLERMFAKPFVGALTGHSDGVCSLMRTRRDHISCVVSGSCDGEIRIWSLTSMKCRRPLPMAHTGWVRAISDSHDSSYFVTCSDDKTIKVWPLRYDEDDEGVNTTQTSSTSLGGSTLGRVATPNLSIVWKEPFRAVDHHWRKQLVASCSSNLDIWDLQRPSDPVQTFSWASDSLICARFNPSECNVLASCASDRSIVLYDLAAGKQIRRLVMEQRCNSLRWNPMEPFNFVVANEDHNLYTFDMRKMSSALFVHKDHVSSVLDVDFSPTGREFVTGSYDRTVRIFRYNEGHSRDVYHTKRMQRIFCVMYSGDSNFVMSGSDDMNVRLWKADASKALTKPLPREQEKLDYSDRLKKRFSDVPEIKRIRRHRHLPNAIYRAAQTKSIISSSQKEKDDRRRKHSRPGSIPFKVERKKHVVKEDQ